MVKPPDALLDVSQLQICPSVVTMVALEAVLNPTSDMQLFVDQLFIVEKLLVRLMLIFCMPLGLMFRDWRV